MTHLSFFRRRSGGAALAGFIAVLGLAACEDGGGAQPGASTSDQAQTSTPQQQGTQSAPQAQPNASAQRIDIAQCAQPRNGRVIFQIGAVRLGVPDPAIVNAIPSSLKPPIAEGDAATELRRQAATGAGCPEKPLDARLVAVNDTLGHPLLRGTALLGRGTPRAIQDFVRVTKSLQATPPETCRTMKGGLIACVGAEQRGERNVPVMYLVTTDRAQKLNSGGPLAVRCVGQPQKIQGCTFIDTLSGGLIADIALNPGTYTSAELAQAHAAAFRRLRSYAN